MAGSAVTMTVCARPSAGGGVYSITKRVPLPAVIPPIDDGERRVRLRLVAADGIANVASISHWLLACTGHDLLITSGASSSLGVSTP